VLLNWDGITELFVSLSIRSSAFVEDDVWLGVAGSASSDASDGYSWVDVAESLNCMLN